MKVLHLFTGGSDGARPLSTLILDAAGSLYGTTSAGGADNNCTGMGCGTAFRLSPDGSMAILHRFGSDQGPPRLADADQEGRLSSARPGRRTSTRSARCSGSTSNAQTSLALEMMRLTSP